MELWCFLLHLSVREECFLLSRFKVYVLVPGGVDIMYGVDTINLVSFPTTTTTSMITLY